MSSLLLIPSFLGSLVTGMFLGATRDRKSYVWIWGLFVIVAAFWIGLALALISLIGSAVDGRLVSSALQRNGFGSILSNSACKWLVFCLPSIPVFVTALLMFPRRNKS